MPKVNLRKATDKVIMASYNRLKELLLVQKKKEAVQIFETEQLITCWVELLHFAMIRRNCPVSSLVVEQVISRRLMDKSELRKKVLSIDQDVTRDFSNRVMNYINSGKFDVEIEKLIEVRSSVEKPLKARLGIGIYNPDAYKAS